MREDYIKNKQGRKATIKRQGLFSMIRVLIILISLTLLTSCITINKTNNFYFENLEVSVKIEVAKEIK